MNGSQMLLTTWKTTQKNQARRMYPGTSQASFLRFSSLSQIRMVAVVDDSREDVEGGLESRLGAGAGGRQQQRPPQAASLPTPASTNHWWNPPTQNHP